MSYMLARKTVFSLSIRFFSYKRELVVFFLSIYQLYRLLRPAVSVSPTVPLVYLVVYI